MKKANGNNGVTTVTTSTPSMGGNEQKTTVLGGQKCKIWPVGENAHLGGYTEGRASKDGLPAQPGERRKFVALNESGTQRIGEDHPRARLSNDQVEAMRDDYERYPPGHPRHEGYRVLAKRYGCSKRTARDICNYEKRNQWAARWKRVT